MPSDDSPFSAADDNKAAFVPSELAPAAYHCPNTVCDGHYYLAARELGRELTCAKCGLAVRIGNPPSVAEKISAPSPVSVRWGESAQNSSALFWNVIWFVVGVVLGFLGCRFL